MNERARLNVRRINELWSLHDPNEGQDFLCLAFVVDRRYVPGTDPGLGHIQFRVGVSFGHNPFDFEGCILPPRVQGRFVFGFHTVGVVGNQLTLYGMFESTREAGDCEDPEEAVGIAQSMLDAMTDEDYRLFARNSSDNERPLRTSDLFRLEDFEIVESEAF